MSAELVLITGISGFIGYRVLVTVLEAGYVVRGVVRSQSKVEKIKDSLSDPSLIDMVDFAVVTDMAIPNAFDHLMDGVSFVFHIASPIDKPSDDYERDTFRPAIDMVINILSASAKAPKVKRVVVTSSITPLISGPEFLTGKFSSEVFRADDEIHHYDMKAKFDYPLLAYAASKAMSLEAAEKFIKIHNPHFDTVFLMPTLVVGVNNLAKTAEETLSSTSGLLLKLLLGRPGSPIIGTSVHIQDVADLHILALNPKVTAGRYLVSSEGAKGTNWHDGFAIVEKYFPDAAGAVFVAAAERYVVPANVDTLKTQEAFGFTFRSFEEQVKSAVGNYLALLARKSGA